jgi:hypothetical protein
MTYQYLPAAESIQKNFFALFVKPEIQKSTIRQENSLEQFNNNRIQQEPRNTRPLGGGLVLLQLFQAARTIGRWG